MKLNKYWFKPKRYGLGAYPSSWEGWFLVIAYVVIIVYLSLRFDETYLKEYFVSVIGMVVILVVVSWYKTEGNWKWRWGK